jgi:hypothetical protein
MPLRILPLREVALDVLADEVGDVRAFGGRLGVVHGFAALQNPYFAGIPSPRVGAEKSNRNRGAAVV